jgi:hypothetical protein
MTLNSTRPLAEVTEQALRMLVQELGAVNTARFLSQFSHGSGDSVAMKEQLFGQRTVDELVAAIEQRKRNTPTP